MWFNNATIYHYECPPELNIETLISQDALKPCPAHARFIYGWVPAFHDAFTHETAGFSLVCLGKEMRVLPRSVVNRILEQRVLQLETQRGYPVKRAESAQMAEDVEFELLPQAFCVQKRLFALFDHARQRLIINTSSKNSATQVLAMLRKSIPEMSILPLIFPDKLAMNFTNWIMYPETLPANTQLAADYVLFSMENENKRFNCKGCSNLDEEIIDLIAKGLAASEISLIWNERIQFTLTQDLTFKRLKCLDLLQEDLEELSALDDQEEQQQASLVLLAGELRELVDHIHGCLNTQENTQGDMKLAVICD